MVSLGHNELISFPQPSPCRPSSTTWIYKTPTSAPSTSRPPLCWPRNSDTQSWCSRIGVSFEDNKCTDFYLAKFQDIVRLKFWKSWTFPNFRTISVYIDVNFICLWNTWDENFLLQNSASENPKMLALICETLDVTGLTFVLIISYGLMHHFIPDIDRVSFEISLVVKVHSNEQQNYAENYILMYLFSSCGDSYIATLNCVLKISTFRLKILLKQTVTKL